MPENLYLFRYFWYLLYTKYFFLSQLWLVKVIWNFTICVCWFLCVNRDFTIRYQFSFLSLWVLEIIFFRLIRRVAVSVSHYIKHVKREQRLWMYEITSNHKAAYHSPWLYQPLHTRSHPHITGKRLVRDNADASAAVHP